MSLPSLPNDIFLIILELFNTNSDMVSFVTICKSLYKRAKKYGYVRKIHFRPRDDPIEFAVRTYEHIKTLKIISTDGLDDITAWVPVFAEEMVIDGCITPLEGINPQKASKTRKLSFYDYGRHYHKRMFKMNWEKFPNLESITLLVHDVNLIEMVGSCPILRHIVIKYCTEEEHFIIKRHTNKMHEFNIIRKLRLSTR